MTNVFFISLYGLVHFLFWIKLKEQRISEDGERGWLPCVSPEPLLQKVSMHFLLGVGHLILKDGFHLPGKLLNGFK